MGFGHAGVFSDRCCRRGTVADGKRRRGTTGGKHRRGTTGGNRRRGGYDRGFVLSDHADWPGLQGAIAATGAERVIVTHGYEAEMVRWLQQQGLQAGSFQTEYGGDDAAAAG